MIVILDVHDEGLELVVSGYCCYLYTLLDITGPLLEKIVGLEHYRYNTGTYNSCTAFARLAARARVPPSAKIAGGTVCITTTL